MLKLNAVKFELILEIRRQMKYASRLRLSRDNETNITDEETLKLYNFVFSRFVKLPGIPIFVRS